MRIFPAGYIDVQIHTQLIGEGRVKFMGQIGIEIPHSAGADFDVIRKIRPAAKVHHDLRQSFVEGTTRFAEATNASGVTGLLSAGLTIKI